jgi:uncharacterized membrane protein YkvA (DUF1232 family)
MPEVANFVRHGASQITLKILRGMQKQLPLLKVEFAQINAPKFPHLVDQLEFLANVVEDFTDGADEEIPLAAVASAAFALVYAHRQMDLIPDHNPDFGRADDSAIVRAVLMEQERVFEAYARRHRLNWSKITVKP